MTTTRVSVDLEYEGPYDTDSALALIAAHTITGVERTDVAARSHTRVLSTDAGPVAVTVAFIDDRVRLTLEGPRDAPVDLDALVTEVRWWLDLDADLATVTDVLGGDPVIGPLVAARPGLRVVGNPDIAQAAVTTVLGQQVSVAAGGTFAARLAAAYGEPGPAGLVQFPRPAALARVDVEELRATVGLTASRARTVVAVATAFADGIGITRDTDPADARARLLSIPGVGPWTADYLAVRALGDRDAFPAGDLVLRRAMAADSATAAAAVARAWSPLRAYAAVHLWTSTVYAGNPATAT